MSYQCKILKDSVSDQLNRLTTFQITFPRFILAEFNTHRMISRNAASSRAIPVNKRIQSVVEDPFVPVKFGMNRKGMSADETIPDEGAAVNVWSDSINDAIDHAEEFERLQVHKQLANRVLEPYAWVTVIATATDWDNFFELRTAKDVQPEFRTIALMMSQAYIDSKPTLLRSFEYHLPLMEPEEMTEDMERNKKISIGRCARVSYLTHDGKRDPDADVALYERLMENHHLSPLEHVARPLSTEEIYDVFSIRLATPFCKSSIGNCISRNASYVGNLRGWASVRMESEYALSN